MYIYNVDEDICAGGNSAENLLSKFNARLMSILDNSFDSNFASSLSFRMTLIVADFYMCFAACVL